MDKNYHRKEITATQRQHRVMNLHFRTSDKTLADAILNRDASAGAMVDAWGHG